jgi:hypothetical protein
MKPNHWTRDQWTFANYIEEIVLLSEISEIPGVEDKRLALIREAWGRYPEECEMLGLRDGVK